MIYSDRELSQKLESTEGRANADFVETRLQHEPESGAAWTEIGGAYAMFDGPGSPLTQTFCLGIFEETQPVHLDRLEGFFKERSAPVFHEVSPMTEPSLLTLLGARGYRPIELTSVMYRELDNNVPSPGVNAIETRIVNDSESGLWAETAAAGWATEFEGLGEFMLRLGRITSRTKGSRPFIAELDGKPIAAGGFGIYDDVCILAGAATIPEFRGRGAQNALLAARLRFAADEGCSLAMMGAAPGSQSQKNAQRNGFQIAYTRTKWELVD